MAGVNAKLGIQIAAVLEGSNDLGNPTQKVSVAKELALKPGTDATNKADILWSDSRTLAASASEDLDLAGALTNAFGATVACAEVVAIYVAAADANTNNVVIGGAATNAFVGPFGAAAHTMALKPGEFVLLSSKAGWAVTAGTGDLLKVANSGAGSSVTYSIVIIGRSAAA